MEDKKDNNKVEETSSKEETNQNIESEVETLEAEMNADNSSEEESSESQLSETEQLKIDLAEAKDKYLRLFSEFENFRRRTSREKLDMISTANESLVVAMLPVVDDIDRALANINDKTDLKTFEEGVKLIQSKFANTLQTKGVSKVDTKKGDDFNDEIHEAITQIPAPTEDLKGKIIDVIEPGYKVGEKVVRFAKVVTGA
uniref:nucleotide exchange factor GrpE n=1 Tax=Fulvivirga sp. TaxID=1931237 RepID=UPI00404911D1